MGGQTAIKYEIYKMYGSHKLDPNTRIDESKKDVTKNLTVLRDNVTI